VAPFTKKLETSLVPVDSITTSRRTEPDWRTSEYDGAEGLKLTTGLAPGVPWMVRLYAEIPPRVVVVVYVPERRVMSSPETAIVLMARSIEHGAAELVQSSTAVPGGPPQRLAALH